MLARITSGVDTRIFNVKINLKKAIYYGLKIFLRVSITDEP